MDLTIQNTYTQDVGSKERKSLNQLLNFRSFWLYMSTKFSQGKSKHNNNKYVVYHNANIIISCTAMIPALFRYR